MYGKLCSILLLMPACFLGLQVSTSEAQIVRRFPGGGVAIRAPFVRVNVNPWGGTSVRAPFVGIDSGAVRIGQQRRIARRQWRAERRAAIEAQAEPAVSQVQAPAPTPAQAPPLPSPEQMAEMEMAELLATLRDMSRLLDDSLLKFDEPGGWQQYLEIPDDALGTPGVSEVALQSELLEKQLNRYRNVSVGEKFRKIAEMPSFAATHAALELVMERVEELGAEAVQPAEDDWQYDPGPVTAPQPQEALPVPPNPEPRRGERSILKRG